MPATRLPFAIEDLELEIRKVCGGNTAIAILLDGENFDKVVAELNHSNAHEMIRFVPIGFSCIRATFKGVSIVRRENHCG